MLCRNGQYSWFIAIATLSVNMEGVMGMRDIIAYHYFDIDAVIVFDVMKNNLPAIKMTIDKMLFDI